MVCDFFSIETITSHQRVMLYDKKQLERLIPQRAPILMLDGIEAIEGETIHSVLTIAPDNFFLVGETLQEMALIEHQAQTASALAGHKALATTDTAPIGMIGEVKNFVMQRLPKVGETLHTSVTFLDELGGITLIKCTTLCQGEPVAETKMKIFVE